MTVLPRHEQLLPALTVTHGAVLLRVRHWAGAGLRAEGQLQQSSMSRVFLDAILSARDTFQSASYSNSRCFQLHGGVKVLVFDLGLQKATPDPHTPSMRYIFVAGTSFESISRKRLENLKKESIFLTNSVRSLLLDHGSATAMCERVC